MIASERSHQDLSEEILILLVPCEGIVEFRHTLPVVRASLLEILNLSMNIILIVLIQKNISKCNAERYYDEIYVSDIRN